MALKIKVNDEDYTEKYRILLKLFKHTSWLMIPLMIIILFGIWNLNGNKTLILILIGCIIVFQGIIMWKCEKKWEKEQDLKIERAKTNGKI